MALNTKQKRGSAMLVGIPFRSWTTEPAGASSAGARASLARLCSSAATPAATTQLIYRPQSRRVANLRRM